MLGVTVANVTERAGGLPGRVFTAPPKFIKAGIKTVSPIHSILERHLCIRPVQLCEGAPGYLNVDAIVSESAYVAGLC